MISEFLAANKNGLTDEDGDYSDWIEIYNPGHRPVNLSGWSLTDDPGYVEILRAGLVSIPSISIVTEMDNLGIYAHPREEGPARQRPASIELIDPAALPGQPAVIIAEKPQF